MVLEAQQPSGKDRYSSKLDEERQGFRDESEGSETCSRELREECGPAVYRLAGIEPWDEEPGGRDHYPRDHGQSARVTIVNVDKGHRTGPSVFPIPSPSLLVLGTSCP